MMTPLPSEYSAFWKLWENGEYFECHEVLEIAWRREANPERKLFFQGLIHCAVALVHVDRQNEIGARGQLTKAQIKLHQFKLHRFKLHRLGAEYSGCDIRAVLEFVENKLNEAFEPRLELENLT